jgi:hypothetical protein
VLEALGRVELPTYGLGNRRSIHLSYGAIALTALLAAAVPFGSTLRISMRDLWEWWRYAPRKTAW